jgi:radical SAM protein with 4Fe4S-binding SPASM domain
MMKANYLGLAEVARVAKRYQAPLRVNVYQSVRSDVFALSYEEYWQGFRALLAQTDVIAIGEPLVRAMAGLPARVGGCGASTVRVTPQATTQPCVYWPGAGEPLSFLLSLRSGAVETPPFIEARTAPEACRSCLYLESCYGGCAGRRHIQNAQHQPDYYCPIVRGEAQQLEIRMAPAREFPKSESACTTIVVARD